MSVLKSIRINEDVFKKLEIMAKKQNRTLSNLINKILSDFTKKE